jgi:hypothetical protein
LQSCRNSSRRLSLTPRCSLVCRKPQQFIEFKEVIARALKPLAEITGAFVKLGRQLHLLDQAGFLPHVSCNEA